MASRFTCKDLENSIKEMNIMLADSGSVYHYVIGSAYGDTQVNLHSINFNGVNRNQRNIEMGSPRNCDDKMISDHYNWLGKTLPDGKRTRKGCKAILSLSIDFTRDSVQLSSFELITLAKWAKLTKYRKPLGACYSLGTAFYIHLQKKVK